MSDCGVAQWMWNEGDGLGLGLGGVRAAAAYIVAGPACRAVSLVGLCRHRATGRGGGPGTAWCVGPGRAGYGPKQRAAGRAAGLHGHI